VPVVVIEATDAEALQLAIIENVQRADLNALEEAEGYRALMEEFHNSQEDIARIVGKSRSYIANTLRLLKLPDAVKDHIQTGKLTAGHARMLIGEPNAEQLAEDIVARDLNVREVEAMARERAKKSGKKQTGGKRASGAAKDADTLAAEKRLTDALGLTVSIDERRGGGGTLSIRYRDVDQLDEVIRRLERRS
jgi:ParB family transcriptional regulator, chromosome partitioning protein